MTRVATDGPEAKQHPWALTTMGRMARRAGKWRTVHVHMALGQWNTLQSLQMKTRNDEFNKLPLLHLEKLEGGMA